MFLSGVSPVSLILILVVFGCDSGSLKSEPEGEFISLTIENFSWLLEDENMIHSNYKINTGLSVSSSFDVEDYWPWMYHISLWSDNLNITQNNVVDPHMDLFPHSAKLQEINGDAIIATYHPAAPASGGFEITSYDPATRVLEGTFEVTFVVDDGYRTSERRLLPDTVRVTDGRFRVTVEP